LTAFTDQVVVVGEWVTDHKTLVGCKARGFIDLGL
jgi:hypothetical protein